LKNGTVIEQLKHIIAEDLDVNLSLEDINEESSLFEDGLGLDSVSVMEFITMIEERFKFQFSDAELNIESFKSLQMLANIVSNKLKDNNK
jgi:acyl carrier protein